MIIYIFIVIFIVVMIRCIDRPIEHYNDEVGTYCTSCKAKNTINKCSMCYNCVWLYDQHRCVDGSGKGPYNLTNMPINGRWFSEDTWYKQAEK
jgi:hypothetical protein